MSKLSLPLLVASFTLVSLILVTTAHSDDCVSNATFVADVTVPDGTDFQSGESFKKVWRLKNEGNCPWGTEFSLVWIGGDGLGIADSQAMPQAVDAGDTVDVGVEMRAPDVAGTYTSRWQMRDDLGTRFGQEVFVKIEVGASSQPMVGTGAPREKTGELLSEARWKVVGVDCNPTTEWELDSVMKCTQTGDCQASCSNQDEWTVNPHDWTATRWTDGWNSCTREKTAIGEGSPGGLFEYLPKDLSVKFHNHVTLGSSQFWVEGRDTWLSGDGDPDKARWAWVLSNSDMVSQDFGDNRRGKVMPGDLCVRYDQETGILVSAYRKMGLYDGATAVANRYRYTYLTSPDFGDTVTGIALGRQQCAHDPPHRCAPDHTVVTSFHIYCQNSPESGGPDNKSCKPQAGQDVTVVVTPPDPEKVTIRYSLGQTRDDLAALEDCSAETGKTRCTIPYSVWRELARPQKADPFSPGADFVYVDVVVRDGFGHEETWGTAIKPPHWNRPPQWKGEPAFTPQSPMWVWGLPESEEPSAEDLLQCGYNPIEFSAVAEDPDGDRLSYTWYVDGSHAPALDGKSSWTWSDNTNPALDWQQSVEVVASDPYGGEVRKTLRPRARHRRLVIRSPKPMAVLSGDATILVDYYQCGGLGADGRIELGLYGTGRRRAQPGDADYAQPVTIELDSGGAEYSVESSILLPNVTTGQASLTVQTTDYWDGLYNLDVVLGPAQGPCASVVVQFLNGQTKADVSSYMGLLWTDLWNASDCSALFDKTEEEKSWRDRLDESLSDCAVNLVSFGPGDHLKVANDVCGIAKELQDDNQLCASLKAVQLYADNNNEYLALVGPAYVKSELLLNAWGCANSIGCSLLPELASETTGRLSEGGKGEQFDLDLHVIDRYGRHVGVNYDSGEYEYEIPGAEASGDLQGGAEFISVPSIVGAHFYVDARDAENTVEYYTFTVSQRQGEQEISSAPVGQTIRKGERLDHLYHVESTGETGTIDVGAGTALVFGNGVCDPGETPKASPHDCDTTPPDILNVSVPEKVTHGERATIRVDAVDDSAVLLCYAVMRGDDGSERDRMILARCPSCEALEGVWDTTGLDGPGTYFVDVVVLDEAENKSLMQGITPVRVLESGRADTEPLWDAVFATRAPVHALHRVDLATEIGDSTNWPETVPDPKQVLGSVGSLQIRGYALGEEQDEMKMSLQVPPDADVVSIPLATALNGPVDETDSEAGVEISITDSETGETSKTHATNIMETLLDAPYLYAFGDVSPFCGREVELSVTLLQPDVCSGAQCTHDIDLYAGPVVFQRLPDICTTLADGSHLLYDYLNDPTPVPVETCVSLQPFSLLDVSANASQPFQNYGAGEDIYRVAFELPEEFKLLDFRLHYGPRIERMTVNEHDIPAEVVHQSFPMRRGTYNRVEPSARYSFTNNAPGAVASLFRPGENTMEIVVAADKPWEERPFSLFARFLVR